MKINSKYRVAKTPWGTMSPGDRKGIVIHHSVTAEGGSQAGVEAIVRGINRQHPRGAYNFAVDYLGNVWEITGLNNIGGHAAAPDIDHWWGICYIGDGRYNFTAAAEKSIKETVAYLQGKAGRTLTIKGHGDINATACPGSIIVKRLRAGAFSADYTAPATGGGSGRSTTAIKTYQKLLIAKGYNLGPWGADGKHGSVTDTAVRAFQKAHGLVVDGIVGPVTLAALRGKTAKPKPPKRLTVDGIWGTLTTKALQRALGVTDDGIIGPNTISALQRKLRVRVDGVLGPITRKGLQRHLKVRQDGIWGINTTKALQRRLNAGTF